MMLRKELKRMRYFTRDGVAQIAVIKKQKTPHKKGVLVNWLIELTLYSSFKIIKSIARFHFGKRIF